MRRTTLIFLSILFLACSKNNNIVEADENVSSNMILKEKYTNVLGVQTDEISNINLYSFVDEWIGVKYKYGGMSKEGVDCSGFCNMLYAVVYKQELPRTTTEISKKIDKVSKDRLEEGHIVVFNIANKKNSHVGVYLKNKRFVHASSSKGVLISSLDNPYYVKAYSKGGSVK